MLQITKDVTNRYKLLQGYKVHYIPGWDCHGMPIEQKALEKVKADHLQLKPMDIRKRGDVRFDSFVIDINSQYQILCTCNAF